jgi:4-hydroxy-L-threonine phosphate dehydrogenase PdxA
VRTSPDHGTAYDIAGKGDADPTSFRNAVFMACDIYKFRKSERELIANQLQTASDKAS